jgi:hypothetical protein
MGGGRGRREGRRRWRKGKGKKGRKERRWRETTVSIGSPLIGSAYRCSAL